MTFQIAVVKLLKFWNGVLYFSSASMHFSNLLMELHIEEY